MSGFYSSQALVCSPNVSRFSDLINLRDISFDPLYVTISGYTEDALA